MLIEDEIIKMAKASGVTVTSSKIYAESTGGSARIYAGQQDQIIEFANFCYERGREDAIPGEYVRYCRECGHIGSVDAGYRDCCPDGSSATRIHPEIAKQAKHGLITILAAAQEAKQVSESEADTAHELGAGVLGLPG